MKLTSAQIKHAASQFDGQAIPENHRLISDLSNLFGEHTFFLGTAGLHILEAAEVSQGHPPTAKLVKLASWTDAGHDTLAPHSPELTDVIIRLDEAA
jgi:hypothetical protein